MKLTRRSALAALAGAGLGLPAQKATAFGLIGDRYHNSDYIRVGLNQTIAADLGVSIDFTGETRALKAETLNGYRLLIMLIWPEGYPDESSNAAWAAKQTEARLRSSGAAGVREIELLDEARAGQFVVNGGSALFLHNVTQVGLTDPDFLDVLGSGYEGHPAISARRLPAGGRTITARDA